MPADTLYVGQQVDYVVDVQLNESARQRLRRNPTFFPPEMPGVLAYDLAPPAALTRVGRRCFETLSYRRALFPLFAGRTAIAPAALTYSLPLSTSFFSREESFELRTDSVRFVALDVPVVNRPPDFTGAVGELGATSRLSAQRGRMGDPVVLTLRLEGTGNVKLWPRPPSPSAGRPSPMAESACWWIRRRRGCADRRSSIGCSRRARRDSRKCRRSTIRTSTPTAGATRRVHAAALARRRVGVAGGDGLDACHPPRHPARAA